MATVVSSDLEGFLRHGERVLVNDGTNYVYGDLFMSGGCLRISYVDPDRDDITNGLLPVWPAVVDLESRDGTVVVLDEEGRVLAREGDTARLSGRAVWRLREGSSWWEWVGEPGVSCSGPYWVVGDEVSAGEILEGV